MNFAQAAALAAKPARWCASIPWIVCGRLVAARWIFCIENDELCIENDEFCTTNDEFCIENDEFCIENDEFGATRWRCCCDTVRILSTPDAAEWCKNHHFEFKIHRLQARNRSTAVRVGFWANQVPACITEYLNVSGVCFERVRCGSGRCTSRRAPAVLILSACWSMPEPTR